MKCTLSDTTQQIIESQEQWEKFKKAFWDAKPYAHHCIDNFLSLTFFPEVVKDFRAIDGSANPTEVYSSDIELNKVCFEVSNTYNNAQKVVDCLASPYFLEALESLLGIKGVIPLSKFRTDNKSTRKYLHIMRDKGFLGSHVDQSHIDLEYIHILSCIFYASEQWGEDQGGHTTLFTSDGSQAVTKINYQPNRLAIFLHTSTSFHGVSKLNTSNNRYSIYMDYYLPIQKLDQFKEYGKQLTNQDYPSYWQHDVVFFSVDSKSNYTQHYNQYRLDGKNPDKYFHVLKNPIQRTLQFTKSRLKFFKNKFSHKIKTLFS